MADTWTPVRPSGRRGISPEATAAAARAADALDASALAPRPAAAPTTPTVFMNSRRLASGGASMRMGIAVTADARLVCPDPPTSILRRDSEQRDHRNRAASSSHL